MKRLLLLLVLLTVAGICVAIDGESLSDPALEARYQNLTHLLRCPKCQNETISDSPAGVAVDLRNVVRRMLLEGHTDDEIVKFMTERYGDFVLYSPPLVARTWILWGMPFAGLLLAIVIATIVIRKRARLPIDTETEQGT